MTELTKSIRAVESVIILLESAPSAKIIRDADKQLLEMRAKYDKFLAKSEVVDPVTGSLLYGTGLKNKCSRFGVVLNDLEELLSRVRREGQYSDQPAHVGSAPSNIDSNMDILIESSILEQNRERAEISSMVLAQGTDKSALDKLSALQSFRAAIEQCISTINKENSQNFLNKHNCPRQVKVMSAAKELRVWRIYKRSIT